MNADVVAAGGIKDWLPHSVIYNLSNGVSAEETLDKMREFVGSGLYRSENSYFPDTPTIRIAISSSLRLSIEVRHEGNSDGLNAKRNYCDKYE